MVPLRQEKCEFLAEGGRARILADRSEQGRVLCGAFVCVFQRSTEYLPGI